MKKLLNLEENLQLKIRRDIFKLSASVPENFRFFCITFKQKDKSALKRLSYYIENDVELLYFIMQAEKKYKNCFLQNKEYIYSILSLDEFYLKNAKTIADYTKLNILEFLYIAVNYIDDAFPVIITHSLNREEKDLIKFLLYKGNKIDYLKQNNISEEKFNFLIKSICQAFNCYDINTALNRCLIEKYLRKDNNLFLNQIKNFMHNEFSNN